MYQIGWFSSGRDEAARDLLKAAQGSIRQGEIKAKIAFVFLSCESGEAAESDLFIKQVRSYQIPLVSFSYQKFRAAQGADDKRHRDSLPEWRLDYDRQVMSRLKDFRPDLGVLAGYMLIVGREMCSRYNMINLHPAAPGGPAGTWQEVIYQLIDEGATETGVMMHLVTPELDKGPVVTYCTFPIRGEPFDCCWQEIEGKTMAEVKVEEDENNVLFKLIRKHGLTREFPLIITTLNAFSQGKVKVINGRIVDHQGKPNNGYDLTGEINQLIKGRL